MTFYAFFLEITIPDNSLHILQVVVSGRGARSRGGQGGQGSLGGLYGRGDQGGQVGQGGQGGLVVRRKRRIRILAPSYVKNFLAVSIFSNYINCATLVWWSNEGEVARVEATI